MKEGTLILMRNQLNEMTKTMEAVKQELFNLRTIAVGTMQLVEKLDGYEEALSKLKEDLEKDEPKLEE